MPTKPQLLAALTVCCILLLHVVPSTSELRCRCRRTTSTPIPRRLIKKLEFMPAGGHCRQDEIIVTKRNGFVVCIDPDAGWLPELLRLSQSTGAVKTPPAHPL
ncbi:interleukin-8 isoform X2 [Centroberyx gerrardi]